MVESPICTTSRTDSPGSDGSWGNHTTRRCHCSSDIVDRSTPSTRTTPDPEPRSPATTRSNVDLPAPDGPVTLVNEPAGNEHETKVSVPR